MQWQISYLEVCAIFGVLGGPEAPVSAIYSKLRRDPQPCIYMYPLDYDFSAYMQFLSPPVQVARWAHMHYFLSCRLSVCSLSGLDRNGGK